MIYNFEQIELEEALKIYSSFAKTREGISMILNQRSFLSKEEIEKRHEIIKIFEDFEDDNIFEISELEIFLKPLIKDLRYIFKENELFNLLKRINILNKLKENLKKLNNNLVEEFLKEIFDPKPFETYEKLFDEEGLFKKDGTENLKKLYKKEKIIFTQIQKSLEKEIEKYKDFLSEQTFMFKNERYCLPVKKNYQKKVEGVFWEMSNSKETVFIEPSSLLILNNSYKSILNEIELEKQKICAEITEKIKFYLNDLLKSLKTLHKIDFFNALGKFKKELKGTLPEIIKKEEGITLNKSFHPILYWLKKKENSKVVPLNFKLSPPKKALILTGPNGGGKTIALKTIGLMISLGLMGFPLISGDGTKIPLIENLLISIGDAQNLEKGLSSFTSVISNLSHFLNLANPSSFCLIDEVGFGTNPQEGSALGISILKGLADREAYIVATTHIDYIKFLSLEDERFTNGSMAFDKKTGLPTFEFIKDLMGQSNALQMALKFGMPEEIVERAKNYLDKKSQEAEIVLEKLQNIVNEREKELENLRIEREKLIKTNEKIKKEREEEKEKLKIDFENFKKNFWEKLNKEIEILREKGVYIGKKKEEKLIVNLTPEFPIKEEKIEDKSFKINSTVFHKILRKKGILVRLDGEIGVVNIEGKNFWVNLDELEKINDKEPSIPVNFVLKREQEVKNSINLIGKRVEEAIEEIDIFLDNSMKYNIEKVEIIHGHGTGKLRKGIREYLKNHPLVLKFEASKNDGATFVELKNG